ncbi:acrosin-like isoform X2 [Oryzias latipes]|uniref:acrosin-like isoform X2 n=1 Tax=Oryzias latipes TaxID=8090 RepID=UPI000CE1C560|nr:acrosin-like isoform X2 [Oryzias latipes]XP_023814019.1 acrosin-like isoform X2 [Oryzias latipes]
MGDFPFLECCLRLREQQAQREAQMHIERDGHTRSIYFIPFPRRLSRPSSEDPQSPDLLDEVHRPPRYSTTVFYELPPSYNELGLKPDDSPPPYTEHDFSTLPPPPPPPPLPPTNTPHSRIQALP